MNKKEKSFKKIRALQQIAYTDRNKRNCARYWKGVSYEHWRVMSDIVWKLANQGYEVFTECTVKGNRMDMVAISSSGDLFCIEILKSEPEARYEQKLNDYDINFQMVKVRTKNFKIEDWEL